MSNISLKNNNIELNAILETVNSLSSGKEEQEKSVEITENRIQTVLPDEGKTLSKVTVNINVPSKEEQEKSVEITSNGTQVILPDDGKTLSKVSITTNVEGVGGDAAEERSKWLNRGWAEFSDNELTDIKGGTFAFCTSLSSVNFPLCNSVGSYAFYMCRSLSLVNFPLCNIVWGDAFYNCTSLTSVDLPSCFSVNNNAFYGCTSLSSVNLPVCSYVGYSAFNKCASLSIIELPLCPSMYNNAFTNCSSLTSVDLPICSNVGYGAFSGCTSLSTIDLPVCSFIGMYAFSGCTSLTSLTLRYSSVAALSNINAFTSTPMSISTLTGTFGSIYVPASLVDAYKSATNWVTYADRICGIERIKDISDMIIPLNTTKACEAQLIDFETAPENVVITSNDEDMLVISNIQSSADNITFNITTSNITGESNATITFVSNGLTFTKSFKVIIVSSPIGDIDDSTLNTNTTQTISIPWYGSEVASNLSVVSSDESKLSISNVQSNIDNISFDITSYDAEDEINITVTTTYNNETYVKTTKITIEVIPVYTVENLNTDYTFVQNNSGYYENNNKGRDNSFAICKVNIVVPKDCTMYVDCINYAEQNWDYGILSNLDTTLELSKNADTNYKESFKTKSMSTIQTVEYDVPAGEHFIYVKFIKDTSGSKNNDSLQFNIRFE